MITCDSLQRKLQGQYITLARPQSVGNQQNSIVHYSLSSFSPDFHWGQRQSFSLFSVHLWKRWELQLSRVVIGLPARSELTSAPLSTIPLSRVQLQSNDGDGAQYQLYSLEWWWQWWRWWCDYIDDGDEDDDDLSQVQNRKRTTELCINSDPAAFFVPRLPRPCLAPRFARGFTIPTKCICSGLFRIQRGFTISKVHQHLFRILWPCLRKPSNYGLSDSLGHLHSVVSAVINLVDMWYLFHFFSIRDPSSPKMRPPIFTK